MPRAKKARLDVSGRCPIEGCVMASGHRPMTFEHPHKREDGIIFAAPHKEPKETPPPYCLVCYRRFVEPARHMKAQHNAIIYFDDKANKWSYYFEDDHMKLSH